MISDAEVRMAEWIIQQACEERRHCDGCPHFFNCGMDSPNDCEIPEPSPEPTERPRIEWLRMLPDGEMAKAMDNMQNGDCSSCEYCLECSWDVDSPCNKGHMDWWHEVVSLEQFRKDVKLND